MENKENNLNKNILMKLVKLSIHILKEENALDSFIYNINDNEEINIKREKELTKYMMHYYLEEYHFSINLVNPISNFFAWSKTSEGLYYWHKIGMKFYKQSRSKFKCLCYYE